jgi:hypothetical protein
MGKKQTAKASKAKNTKVIPHLSSFGTRLPLNLAWGLLFHKVMYTGLWRAKN